MRLWRRPQPEPQPEPQPVEAAPAAVQQAEPTGPEGPPYSGEDDRLPGTAGYGGPLPKGWRRNHMPGTRFKFVRPDGKPD